MVVGEKNEQRGNFMCKSTFIIIEISSESGEKVNLVIFHMKFNQSSLIDMRILQLFMPFLSIFCDSVLMYACQNLRMHSTFFFLGFFEVF